MPLKIDFSTRFIVCQSVNLFLSLIKLKSNTVLINIQKCIQYFVCRAEYNSLQPIKMINEKFIANIYQMYKFMYSIYIFMWNISRIKDSSQFFLITQKLKEDKDNRYTTALQEAFMSLQRKKYIIYLILQKCILQHGSWGKSGGAEITGTQEAFISLQMTFSGSFCPEFSSLALNLDLNTASHLFLSM